MHTLEASGLVSTYNQSGYVHELGNECGNNNGTWKFQVFDPVSKEAMLKMRDWLQD